MTERKTRPNKRATAQPEFTADENPFANDSLETLAEKLQQASGELRALKASGTEIVLDLIRAMPPEERVEVLKRLKRSRQDEGGGR